MNLCLKLLLFLFLFLRIVLAQNEPSADSIKQILKRQVDNKRSVSIVVGIVSPTGREVISCGKLNKDSDLMADGNTIYELGSVTKVFTSLVLEDMAEHGEVDLNDPISKYLPSTVIIPSFKGKEITLLDLSTQRAGLPRIPDSLFSTDSNNPYANYSVKNLYDFLSRYKLTRLPGEKYEYSNLGAGLLGHLLSLKAGENYETLIKKRICKPLNMGSTCITITPDNKSRFASGYNRAGYPVAAWDLPVLAGAGALRSTVDDMLNFLEANLGLKKSELSDAIEKTHIIKAATGFPDIDIAMGWHISKKFNSKIIFHNGATGGFSTFIGMDKERKKGVVVLSNSANTVDDIGFYLLNTKYKLNEFSRKPSVADTMVKAIFARGIGAAVEIYRELFRNRKEDYNFSEDVLYNLGSQLLQAKKIDAALEIYKLLTETYPGFAKSYEKLGDIYLSKDEKELALKNYSKAAELNPQNGNAVKMIERLKSN